MFPSFICTDLGRLDTSAKCEAWSQLPHAGTTSLRHQEDVSEKIALSIHISESQDSQ